MSRPPEDRGAELRALFFESAYELLQALNEGGLQLETRPGDEEVLRSVRRVIHTLKGDSAACGFTKLSELAHEFEDVLRLNWSPPAALPLPRLCWPPPTTLAPCCPPTSAVLIPPRRHTCTS